jgi:DNA-binding NtrC family response regulator
MRHKPIDSYCTCGQPRRTHGRYCKDCHAAKQKTYRAEMKVSAIRNGGTYLEAVRKFKRNVLLKAIKQEGGNLCRVSVRLGVHRNTVNRIMREVGFSSEQVKQYLRSQA